MNSSVALTILTVVLSLATFIGSVMLAVIFYVLRQRKQAIQSNSKPMVKSSPPPMLSSRALLQLKQYDYYDRLHSDSEDSGTVLGRWNGHQEFNEQMYHSVDNSADDLSDCEEREYRSSSLLSSSSGDGWLLSSREDNLNELYQTPSSSTSNSPVMTPRVCVLNLSLKYDFHKGSLTIGVLNASNPPKHNSFSKSLFIVVQLFQTKQNGESEDIDPVYKTDMQSYSKNVLFNDDFTYEAISHNELKVTSIRLSLCSHDRFSRVQALGDFVVDVDEVTLDPVQAVLLQRRIQQEASPVATEEKEKGELSLSLRYQRGSRRINVIVLKASNLRKPKKFMFNDPYVTVKLLYNGEVVSKKKTKAKKGTASPIWNEPFVFDLEDDLDGHLLVFSVKGRDLFSSRTKLGTVCIGATATSTGKDHWNDSVCSKNNTMRQVTMNHKLL